MERTLDNLERHILTEMEKSFKEKLATLPPAPIGYYYYPSEITGIRKEGENYIIDASICLKPIMGNFNEEER